MFAHIKTQVESSPLPETGFTLNQIMRLQLIFAN